MAVLLIHLIGEAASSSAAGSVGSFSRTEGTSWKGAQAHEPAVLISARLENESSVLLPTIKAFKETGAPVFILSNGSHPELESVLASSDSWTIWSHEGLAESKSANMNRGAAIGASQKWLLVADADTRPHFGRPRPDATEATIVQYPRLVRLEKNTWVERIVAMEFAIKTLLTYPRRSALSGTAYFAGSAALIQRSAIVEQPFDPIALVEDIDFSLRCTLIGKAVEYRTEAVFSELAPHTVHSWFVQRRRWASGWIQLCSRYALAVASSDLPIRQRASWLGLLLWRRLGIPIGISFMLIASLRGELAPRSLVMLAMVIQVSWLIRTARVLRCNATLIRGVLDQHMWRSVGWFVLAAVPYQIALWLVDIMALIAPARHWQITPREGFATQGRHQ